MIAARATADRPLRIAIPKGALFADSVRLLGEAGFDTAALADPGRQLIVRTAEAEFVIGKPTDIPVYVAYGAADCGIAGKDALVEAGLDVVELVDLGFGGCRFVVAEPEDAAAEIERALAPPRRHSRGDEVPQHHAGALRRARASRSRS